MSSLCDFVNRNVAKIRLLEKIENHPKFPAAHRGENLLRYISGVAVVFHVYMVLSGWVGVWSFFTRCPSLQLYEKLVLTALRLAVMGVHCVASACFSLNILGGAPVPPCERVSHLYHQFMVVYRSVALPASLLVMIGSLLSLNFEQFARLLIHTPIEGVGLLWHVIVCDAFLRMQPIVETGEVSPGHSSRGKSPKANSPNQSGKVNTAGWAKAPPSPPKPFSGTRPHADKKDPAKEAAAKGPSTAGPSTARVPTNPPGNIGVVPPRAGPPPGSSSHSKSSKKSDEKDKPIDD